VKQHEADLAGFAAGAEHGVLLLWERELGAGFLDRMDGCRLVISVWALYVQCCGDPRFSELQSAEQLTVNTSTRK
jgi:hypothetical protein